MYITQSLGKVLAITCNQYVYKLFSHLFFCIGYLKAIQGLLKAKVLLINEYHSF